MQDNVTHFIGDANRTEVNSTIVRVEELSQQHSLLLTLAFLLLLLALFYYFYN